MGSSRSSSYLMLSGFALVAGVLGDELHGPRPVESHQRDEVVEARWAGSRAGRRACRSTRTGTRPRSRPWPASGRSSASSRGMVSMSKSGCPPARMMLDGAVDDVQVAQAQEVHLEQAQLLHVAHGHLGDHLGVALLHERQMVGERPLGDDHAGRVDGVLADEALERPGHVDHLAHQSGRCRRPRAARTWGRPGRRRG